jgi:hypothetical protein
MHHKGVLMLDQEKLEKLKLKENMHDKSLYIPEGISANHKKDLQAMSSRSYQRHDCTSVLYPMRECNSAEKMKNKGLTYKFKLYDLPKYSKVLSVKDVNWKLKLSALGKVIPDI